MMLCVRKRENVLIKFRIFEHVSKRSDSDHLRDLPKFAECTKTNPSPFPCACGDAVEKGDFRLVSHFKGSKLNSLVLVKAANLLATSLPYGHASHDAVFLGWKEKVC